jgi:hypothetical protein
MIQPGEQAQRLNHSPDLGTIITAGWPQRSAGGIGFLTALGHVEF